MKKKSKISPNEQSKLKTIFVTIGVAIIVFISAIIDSNPTRANNPKEMYKKAEFVDYVSIYKDSIEHYDNKLDSIKAALIEEVDTYIHNVTKKSKMTGEYIVNKCIDYKFDIPLLMAQAHQETHFAANGGRNNVFGIVYKKYSHPNYAVDDYISLMQRRYIINRTPEELIYSGFKMESKNGRYASDPNYSKCIGKLRNNIINNTNIDSLFEKYINLKEKRDSLHKRYFDDPIEADSSKIQKIMS